MKIKLKDRFDCVYNDESNLCTLPVVVHNSGVPADATAVNV